MNKTQCDSLRLVPDCDLLAENAESLIQRFAAELEEWDSLPVILDLSEVVNVTVLLGVRVTVVLQVLEVWSESTILVELLVVGMGRVEDVILLNR